MKSTAAGKRIKKQILETIRQYDRIVICRHQRPDGDAIGSTMGLRQILRAAFPEKDIRVLNEDSSEHLAFLGPEDPPFTDDEYKNALFIVLDCGTMKRISNSHVQDAPFIVKIDHHIDDKPYGDLSWVEEERSSACEMVADFCLSFPDTLSLDRVSAGYLYTGLVTDTGRFRYEGTDGDTMRIAGKLMDCGIEREKIYANLYMDSFDTVRFFATMTNRIRMTPNGVAYLHITSSLINKYGMSLETASNTVGLMDGIRGSLIYIAFIDTPDGNIRVRLRSRFIAVQELATHYHGGGHANASGATLYSRKEIRALLEEADALLKDYKENNEGWL